MANHNHGGNGNNSEPNSAPVPGRWYNLTLGPSFKNNSSTKFCTLRYEFKPASIDKSQAGSLHKNKENRVSVEFQNNQPGKPKVAFEGSSEDYKENDGVLFFDGETFRMEQLHRAVKRLRHVRTPGESNATAAAAVSSLAPPAIVATGTETCSPPLGKMSKLQSSVRSMGHSVPVQVERIDIGEFGGPDAKPTRKTTDHPPFVPKASSVSPKRTNNELDDPFSSIFGEDFEDTPNDKRTAEQGPDMNIPIQNASDDEIADVDVSDGEGEKGPNAAEALRAQVNAEEERQTSSSSGTSGSGSRSSGSGSGSGSSSSDSEASDDDSASSGGEVDI